MGKYVCKCRCGVYYSHDELESAICPQCGEVGENMQTSNHKCHLCRNYDTCPQEKQELTRKAGVCFNFVQK